MSLDEMFAQVDLLSKDIASALDNCQESVHLELLRVTFLGKKGSVTNLLKLLGTLSLEERRIAGKKINELKDFVQNEIQKKQDIFSRESKKNFSALDETLPARTVTLGRLHPITCAITEIGEIFERLGFQIVEGREIELEKYNFEVLNIPLNHPARDDFDTFYLESGALLRSQTSTVQGRIMEAFEPPLAIVAPGRVYRPDTVDASHSFMFHQMEGFWVDKTVTFSDLKGVLHQFIRQYFGSNTKIQFRPSFFPFTEPSVEIDIWFRGKWMEVLGAGSIHPNVFQRVGYKKGKYRGFAFGLGIERMCMMKYQIPDIRYFYENDSRFLAQF